jgi:hypothetical protein
MRPSRAEDRTLFNPPVGVALSTPAQPSGEACRAGSSVILAPSAFRHRRFLAQPAHSGGSGLRRKAVFAGSHGSAALGSSNIACTRQCASLRRVRHRSRRTPVTTRSGSTRPAEQRALSASDSSLKRAERHRNDRWRQFAATRMSNIDTTKILFLLRGRADARGMLHPGYIDAQIA